MNEEVQMTASTRQLVAIATFPRDFRVGKDNPQEIVIAGVSNNKQHNAKLEASEKLREEAAKTNCNIQGVIDEGDKFRFLPYDSLSFLSHLALREFRINLSFPLQVKLVGGNLDKVSEFKVGDVMTQVDSFASLPQAFRTKEYTDQKVEESNSSFGLVQKIYEVEQEQGSGSFVLDLGGLACTLEGCNDSLIEAEQQSRLFFKKPTKSKDHAFYILHIEDQRASGWLLAFDENYPIPDKFEPEIKFLADFQPFLLF